MTPNSPILVEVCVDCVASALAAERGGAGRIELRSSLVEGGVTPSAGLIELTRAAVNLPLHVIIRPRAGDFCYDDYEFKAMQRDIALAKQGGADAVVFGILDVNGYVDTVRTRELIDLARPLPVTFHRAFDMTVNLTRALDELCSIGVDRVLTSGGQATAVAGHEMIAQLVNKAQGRISVMAGSGIKPENASHLVQHTAVKEIHVGLRSIVPSPMLYRNAHLSMGSVSGREYQRFVVLEEDVRKLRAALAECE